MSTNSNIIVKVKKEDVGKILKFNANKLEMPEIKWDKDIKGFEEDVKITNEYIGIYCHWDGYLEGVGETLKNDFNTYEKALNLILGGSCSSIEDNGRITRYATRKGEKWEYLAPKQSDNPISLAKQEFCYLFENGKWKWLDNGEWKEY